MLDKGLINVLAEILDQPAEEVSKYFTPKEPRGQSVKVSTPWTTFETKIEKTLADIQKTLKDDAHQRHALELQLKAINERIDRLEKEKSAPITNKVEDIKEYLLAVRADLTKERNNILNRPNPSVEGAAEGYRCIIQLELIEEILDFVLHE